MTWGYVFMTKNVFYDKFFRSGVPAYAVAAVISVFTGAVFNRDCFRTVTDNAGSGANGVLIIVSMAVLLFTLNFLVSYLLLRFLGKTGKVLVSAVLLINSGVLYAMDTFHAMIDDRMIGNVLHTTYGEASSFFSAKLAIYVLLLGVLPVALLWTVKIRKDGWKKTLAAVLGPLAVIGAVVAANRKNFLWVDRHVPVFGSQVIPWCYIVNTFRYIGMERRANEKEIRLPAAELADSSRAAVVLVIGESARRANFSLYGYEKNTNPLLSQVEGLKTYEAVAAAANTIDAVRAILTRREEEHLHEILPNYLERNGCDVLWNTSNWGEPPLHISHYDTRASLAEKTGGDPEYDGVLFSNVRDFIAGSPKDKVFVVVHTYTSHGPAYYENYPAEFEVFTPVCRSVEVANYPREELVNAYDNTILYTDYLLAGLIEELKGVDDRKCAVIYISDHGESLGEHGRYLHGTGIGSREDNPEEYLVPFIVWSSDRQQTYRDVRETDRHAVFHSVMDFLGLGGETLEADKSIFRE